ncbi:hypothetical protein VDG1235_4104 [Verrucomicrobiia bacterium DG1235]|nr:hypothetical protein VDG1235_4104 [Verrucomicrobiae bacterium DG1235]
MWLGAAAELGMRYKASKRLVDLSKGGSKRRDSRGLPVDSLIACSSG